MQCIWSTAAKATSWNCFRRKTNTLVWHRSRFSSASLRKTTLPAQRAAPFSTAATQHKTNVFGDVPPQSTESSTVPLRGEDSPLPTLTKAQISRASASAVRQCTPNDALYIVNSLYFSTYGSLREEALRVLDDAQRSSRLPLQQHVQFKPIDFGQAVSPRLAAHSFLHMLIRRGHAYQASKFAQLMIENGLQVRTFTMESVIKAVCVAKTSGLLAHHHAWSQPTGPGFSTEFSSDMFSDLGHEAAFRILQLAREHGYRRTEAMYDSLISACLLQGEIIVAALLFACLVKDWQVRAAAKKRAQATADQGESMEDISTTEAARRADIDKRLQWIKNTIPPQSIVYAPYPEVQMLKKITHRIELAFFRDIPPDHDNLELQEALQALAILTELVEGGHLHYGKISPILRALYSTPRTERCVWEHRSGQEPVSVHAHKYFHGVLLRLIKSLKDPPNMTVPPLDARACNSLLHYSLRHRFSPELATDVMEYMVNKRRFQPDIVTFNTLLRSGTILRREDLTDLAVKSIRHLQGRHDSTPIVDLEPPVSAPSLDGRGVASRSQFAEALLRLREERFKLAPEAIASVTQLETDEGTIVSYIAYLTATGRPHLIQEVLFDILPELALIDHPSWGNVPKEERTMPKNVRRSQALQRVVLLGPRVFSAVINALAKAGKTGLAERTWLLAKKAESASWRKGFVDGGKPWYLPVSAYTSLLQCYAKEARQGLPSRTTDESGNIVWKPRLNDRVLGWARLIHRGQHIHEEWGAQKRHKTAKTMAKVLIHSMLSGGNLVVRSLLHLKQLLPHPHGTGLLSGPEPDARFWNATLRLFRPTPSTLQRRSRARVARTRRFMRWSLDKYARTGARSAHWDPLLQEIAEAMLNSGYPIPPGFRHLFIGRYPRATEHFSRPTVDRAPYAFPQPQQRYRAHALPTSKTRGLPIRRRRLGLRERIGNICDV